MNDWNKRLLIYKRNPTREVIVGNPKEKGVIIGGHNPIVIQSMLTKDTLDTEGCINQIIQIFEAGGQMVRLTTQTIRHAQNLQNISRRLQELRIPVPLVADIHFKPEVALEAVKWVEKIRINPGNYADRKKFVFKNYSDQEYSKELTRIQQLFTPLVLECKQRNKALRIGVNHGSLSDRIVSRYGDTAEAMVQSAIEFIEICRAHEFHDIVLSMKASRPQLAVQCYRLLIKRLEERGPDWNYPVHVGVTEVGEGEDGRLKSAIGIGTLLCDGIGDTIRVSLTEPPQNEIPVCKEIIELIPYVANHKEIPILPLSFDPFNYSRRTSIEIKIKELSMGGNQPIRVILKKEQFDRITNSWQSSSIFKVEGIYEELAPIEINPLKPLPSIPENRPITVADNLEIPTIAAFRLLASRLHLAGLKNPIILKDTLTTIAPPLKPSQLRLLSAINIGALLIDGIGDAVIIRLIPEPEQAVVLAYQILQAIGARLFKADFIACPGCGRTLFDIQKVLSQIRTRTEHLKGVKIAVMGCVVNGPGEMADADFGYVGGAPGKVNLYVGKKLIKVNIPEDHAIEELIELIKSCGRWIDPN